MNILSNEQGIYLENTSGKDNILLIPKPDYDNLQNLTRKPLLRSYHLSFPSLWDKTVSCAQTIAGLSKEPTVTAGAEFIFAALYAKLTSNSQRKTILCLDMPTGNGLIEILHDFIIFVNPENSMITLSSQSCGLNAVQSQSCHILLCCLEQCADFSALCDAVCKVRPGGFLLFYTFGQPSFPGLSFLLTPAKKLSYGSFTLYETASDTDLFSQAAPYTTDAKTEKTLSDIASIVDSLLPFFSLSETTQTADVSLYLSSARLLSNLENALLSLYDLLENTELPLLVNRLKRETMYCYIAMTDGDDYIPYENKVKQQCAVLIPLLEQEF